ncbi:O-antigen ligase family protein [Chthonobacter albigriseus]|uniref:O-antigen ligase family protein n=1 Tax=Chthonobacter albigriseus TaxID=1683161 RepID=UPI0015EF0697|nr:O-antigen ligase family protein [Chthonobacter albigriseus]
MSRLGVPRWLVVTVVAVAVIPLGSVSQTALDLSVLLTALVYVVVTVFWREHIGARDLSRTALVLAVLLAAYVAFQALDLPDNPFTHPMWKETAPITGAARRSISIDPAASIAGIGALVAPFLLFAVAVTAAREDRSADRLLRALAAFGLIVALYGLFQLFFMPDKQLYFQRRYFFSTLTSVFVNRNTTATFLGITLVVLIGRMAGAGATVNWPSMLTRLTTPGRGGLSRREWGVLVQALPIAVVGLSLLLTESRAGIAASALGVLVLIAALARRRPGLDLEGEPPAGGLRRAVLVGAGIIALVLAVFGGRVLERAQQVSIVEDLRYCLLPSLARAAADNQPFGTGFATFKLAFEPYRDVACGLTGVLERAHNGYMEGLITLGLPFVLVLAVVVLLLGRTFLRGLKQRNRFRWAGATGLAVLAVMLAHSAVDFSLQIHGVAMMAAAVLGALAGLSRGRSAAPGFR